MTMQQLTRRARDLQQQLNNTARNLHPEEYKKLATELIAVRQQMKSLADESGKTSKTLKATLAVFAGNMLTKAADALKRLAYAGREFVNNSLEMAAAADGVRHAFDSLDQEGLLASLRKATKNTVNDFQLMKAAVQAKDFRIPLQELGKYLQFAQIKAQQTGQSVEYMTNSIITGLGRKSVMILDNLGISAAELNENVKKTGDFMTAVSEIVDNQLLAAGERYDAAADRTQRKTVLLENAQLKLGQRFLWVKDACNDFISFLAGSAISALSTATEKYDELLEEVVRLETEMPELLKQYEELTAKSDRSKEEQEKLKTVIGNIRDMVPSAVSAWGDYGEAIAISTDKVQKFIESQKTLLAYQNREAIEQETKNRDSYRKQYEELTAQQKAGGKKKYAGGHISTEYFYTFSKEELKQLDADITEIGKLQEGAQLTLDRLTGQELESYVNRTRERKRFMAMEKEDLKAWIKNRENATSQYLDIAQEIYSARSADPTVPTVPKVPNDPKVPKVPNVPQSSPQSPQLRQIDTTLEQEINLLKKRRLEELLTEKQYNDSLNQLTLSALKQKLTIKGQERDQLIRYESQTLDLQLKMHAEAEKNLAEAEKADIAAIQKSREQDLHNLQNSYNQDIAILNQSLADRKITKQQHEMMMLALDKNHAERRLEIEREYHAHAQSLELQNADRKVKLVEETAKQVLEAEKTASAARLAEQQKLNSLIKDFKGEFKATTVDEDYHAQQAVLEASYQARKEMAEKNSLDTLELDRAYLRAKEQLQQEHENRLYSIRQQYGLVTLQEEYDMQLLQLQNHLDQNLLTHEQYEKALQKLKRDSVKKQFDYYKTLFSDAVTALQDAETANIEKKYDIEIEAARGNSDEVARLEEEKAQKKLEVEKKYADVNFAIKASQIIADTAVGMMAAFQLGPIAGAIAAALVGITGVAQLAMANAERNKVKNMTLSSGAGSSTSPKTGARIASGREEGGKIDVIRRQDGKYYPDADYAPDRRGYVNRPTVIVGEGPAGQSREWIASNAAVANPTVAPVLDLIDKAQQAGTIRALDLHAAIRAQTAAGYATGGPINTPATPNPPSSSSSPSPIPIDTLMAALTHALSKAEFTAPVVLSELEARKKRLEAARKFGSKHP
jgi:hypothetical protein